MVLLLWCCCGGSAVVLLWWFCCDGALVLLLWWCGCGAPVVLMWGGLGAKRGRFDVSTARPKRYATIMEFAYQWTEKPRRAKNIRITQMHN